MTVSVIRPLDAPDLGVFRELLLQWDDVEAIAAEPELSEQVERARRETGGEVLLAFSPDGSLVGYAQLGVHVMVGMGTAMEVVALLVRDGARGQGIGSALLRRCEEWSRLRGCGLVMLSSQLFRERAHGFYRRQGFREVKRSAFFVKDL